jgi:hypothetical protein
MKNNASTNPLVNTLLRTRPVRLACVFLHDIDIWWVFGAVVVAIAIGLLLTGCQIEGLMPSH